MEESAEPRDKAEGWYVLHDMRKVKWGDWKSLDREVKENILEEAIEFFEGVEDIEEGDSALFSVLGHKADLMLIHIRPTIEELDTIEREFESTNLSDYTRETASHLSVAELGGYSNDEIESGEVNERAMEFVESRLYPGIPDAKYASFYPMNRKRDDGTNWYTLPLEEREEMLKEHGMTGREYAGKVTQIISGSIGLDDWEWGVDLFSDDPLFFKHIVYEMRFDKVSAEYSEFGDFYTGIRFPPHDLRAFMNGQEVPTEEVTGEEEEEDGIRSQLRDLDIYAGKPHGEDVYAMVLYSEADDDELFDEVEGLRSNFEHYGTHVKTAVYESPQMDRSAVVSIWETQQAAETAGGYLSDLPGIVARAGGEEREGNFGTMGMFYTVKPEHRDDFVEKFESVNDLLDSMDGHIETNLLTNVEDENDMFIASLWDEREDAIEFFRSEDFRNTVEWGRDVLADRPRHVFLA